MSLRGCCPLSRGAEAFVEARLQRVRLLRAQGRCACVCACVCVRLRVCVCVHVCGCGRVEENCLFLLGRAPGVQGTVHREKMPAAKGKTTVERNTLLTQSTAGQVRFLCVTLQGGCCFVSLCWGAAGVWNNTESISWSARLWSLFCMEWYGMVWCLCGLSYGTRIYGPTAISGLCRTWLSASKAANKAV